jgi:hypothetical protein
MKFVIGVLYKKMNKVVIYVSFKKRLSYSHTLHNGANELLPIVPILGRLHWRAWTEFCLLSTFFV